MSKMSGSASVNKRREMGKEEEHDQTLHTDTTSKSAGEDSYGVVPTTDFQCFPVFLCGMSLPMLANRVQ